MNRSVRAVVSVLVVTLGLLLGVGAIAVSNRSVAEASSAPCHSSWLTAKVGRGSAAAGTAYITLEIINHETSACTLTGTPIAQPGFHSYSMQPFVAVGPRAVRITYPGRGHTILLKPHGVASVDFGISTAGNYPPSQCGPRNISAVELTFKMRTLSIRLDYPLRTQSVCTKLVSTQIAGVVLGTHFP
jgi:hypothetical protein